MKTESPKAKTKRKTTITTTKAGKGYGWNALNHYRCGHNN